MFGPEYSSVLPSGVYSWLVRREALVLFVTLSLQSRTSFAFAPRFSALRFLLAIDIALIKVVGWRSKRAVSRLRQPVVREER